LLQETTRKGEGRAAAACKGCESSGVQERFLRVSLHTSDGEARKQKSPVLGEHHVATPKIEKQRV